MKDGSGDLDFGVENTSNKSDTESEAETAATGEPRPSDTPVSGGTDTDTRPSDSTTADRGREADTQEGDRRGEGQRSQGDYPYFVRRSNVGDERDKRLECHVRPAVAKDEAKFRNQLAAALETDTVSKTDAREYALQFAFENVDGVAELMREDGFDIVN